MDLVIALWACLAAPPTDLPNLLANPSFEQREGDLPTAWAPRAGETVELRDDGGRSGTHCVRITDPSDRTGISLESDPIPSRPGGQYRAAVWFRTIEPCGPGIYINFNDELGDRIHHVYQRLPEPGAEWRRVDVSAHAPLDAVEVWVSLYGYIADKGAFEVDDVALTVEGGSPPGTGRFPHAEPGDKPMVKINSRLELFVDSFLVDGLTGSAERRLHHPVPREVVLELDRPWEGLFCGYFAVCSEPGRVRLYYRGWPKLDGPDCTCVAESSDGVHFERPELGLFEWDGSKANNIVWMGAGCHNFTPFRDTNPDAPDDQRYKALASAGPKSSLVPFVSPDGLRWRRLQEEPVITKGAFDSQNLAFFDNLRGEYVSLFRDFKDGFRWVKVCRSKDFLTWTEPQWCEYGDAPPEHLYTNASIPYYRAPHIYLGFPCRFVPGRKKVASHREAGINDGVLMSSRDGLNWERWAEAFLRPAADPLCWTDRNNYIAWGLAPSGGDEISLYWTEHYRYPTYRLRRGTVRTDGFASLHAGVPGGEMLTRPLTFTGRKLLVNYATSAIGKLRFELCDAEGTPLPGFELSACEALFGNEIETAVSWRDDPDLAALAGQPVRLRVQLRDADLYSIRFAE